MKKRMLTLALGVVLSLGTAASAMANTPVAEKAPTREVATIAVQPRYIDLSFLSADMDISSSGTATCEGIARTQNKSYHVEMEMTLYKKSGSSWSSVQTWSKVGTAGSEVSLSKTKSGLARGTYRIGVTAEVFNGSKFIESDTIYSNEETY